MQRIANKLASAALLFAAVFCMGTGALAQAQIVPGGKVLEEASQLIVWYNTIFTGAPLIESPVLQVTNGSSDTAVNIHVQIFADTLDGTTDTCREHDFTDTLTPNDTALYILSELDNPLDLFPPAGIESGGDNTHDAVAIDIDFTRGFIVVTPVNQTTLPRRAIAHDHLFGAITVTEAAPFLTLRSPAIGRRAVDFATGDPVPDGTVLDGVTTGFQLLQPSLLSFNFSLPTPPRVGEVFSITFTDNYSDPSGEYRAEPSSVTWDPLSYDEEENATSCQQHVNTCFRVLQINDFFDPPGPVDEDVLCPALDNDLGWAEIAVSGLSGLDNHVGFTHFGLSSFNIVLGFTRALADSREIICEDLQSVRNGCECERKSGLSRYECVKSQEPSTPSAAAMNAQ